MRFSDLSGNQRIVLRLRRYLEESRIPDSMIFAGPPSASPLKFALAWASGCNCLHYDTDSCGKCRPCVEIDAGIFPDLTVLQPDGQFYKKEQIMNLIEANAFRPIVGQRKVTILCDAQRMNESAANAFLKVLEEPSKDHSFILICTNLHALLPTIRSRCHILTFSSMAQGELQRILEEKGFPPDQARLLSFINPDAAVAFQKSQIKKFLERRQASLDLLAALLTEREVERALVSLETLAGNRQKFVEMFQETINLISLFLRDIMMIQIDPDSQSVLNIDLRERLDEMARRTTIQRVLVLIRAMERLLRDTMRNLNTRVLIQELIRTVTWGEVIHG